MGSLVSEKVVVWEIFIGEVEYISFGVVYIRSIFLFEFLC